MAFELTHTGIDAHIAIGKIIRLTMPGQELTLKEAIDVICDVFNAAIENIIVEEFDPQGKKPTHILNREEKIAYLRRIYVGTKEAEQ